MGARKAVVALTVPLVLLAVGAALPATEAAAVVIASGDGSGNTSAPPDDPGFGHVGVRLPGNLSAVYLRNGWVITAAHVGAGTLRLGGVDYAALPGSSHPLGSAGATSADLLLFRLVSEPPLAALAVRAAVPGPSAPLVLVGNGHDRGAATSFEGHDGWGWLPTHALRWGTNRVAQRGLDVAIGDVTTRAFSTVFDLANGAAHEAQAVVGDSGGAVFLKGDTSWELAGILFAIGVYDGQPSNTTLDGNMTFAADLSYYRAQIEAIVDVPACRDGLDDDLDGLIDAADPQCTSPSVASEAPVIGCGLVGAEALAALVALRRAQARSRRRARSFS